MFLYEMQHIDIFRLSKWLDDLDHHGRYVADRYCIMLSNGLKRVGEMELKGDREIER